MMGETLQSAVVGLSERILLLREDAAVSIRSLVDGATRAEIARVVGAEEANPPAIDSKKLASLIDHTLLGQSATPEEAEKTCREALEHGFAAVCVNPIHLALVVEELAGSGVAPCVVCDFPLGASTREVRVFSAGKFAELGAGEVDVVMNVGLAKSGRWGAVARDLRAIADAARPALVKVIIEAGALSDDEKAVACAAVLASGAAFVKTSTGFGPGGATAADVRLLRACVGDRCGVKASGGVRDRETAARMIASGASRIGASAGVSIVSYGTEVS